MTIKDSLHFLPGVCDCTFHVIESKTWSKRDRDSVCFGRRVCETLRGCNAKSAHCAKPTLISSNSFSENFALKSSTVDFVRASSQTTVREMFHKKVISLLKLAVKQASKDENQAHVVVLPVLPMALCKGAPVCLFQAIVVSRWFVIPTAENIKCFNAQQCS